MSPRLFRITGWCLLWALPLHCANRSPEDVLLPLQLSEPTQVLIIGDSLTDYSRGFDLQNLLGAGWQVRYRATPNRDIPYWTLRMDEALSGDSSLPPTHIIVPMGTNDAYLYTPDTFVSNLRDFHATLRLRSSAIVYYCKVPRTRDLTLSPAILANNARLASEPPTDSGLSLAGPAAVRILDLDQAMQSAPAPELLYPDNDPIHPTNAGYRRMGRLMQRALQAP